MPKVSAYELDHIEDEASFEKVRGKRKKSQKLEKSEKKKYRHKKVDY